MNRRQVLAAVGTASLAGCADGVGSRANGRLDLTVQNDREDPITAAVTVTDAAGTTYEDTTERLDAGVGQAFTVVVGRDGRHEVTVAGETFRGQLAWDAASCRLFDGRVRVTPELVAVAGECVDSR